MILCALMPEFFKWEPIKLSTIIPAALFTIIAPGFTEEVCLPRQGHNNFESGLPEVPVNLTLRFMNIDTP